MREAVCGDPELKNVVPLCFFSCFSVCSLQMIHVHVGVLAAAVVELLVVANTGTLSDTTGIHSTRNSVALHWTRAERICKVTSSL